MCRSSKKPFDRRLSHLCPSQAAKCTSCINNEGASSHELSLPISVVSWIGESDESLGVFDFLIALPSQFGLSTFNFTVGLELAS